MAALLIFDDFTTPTGDYRIITRTSAEDNNSFECELIKLGNFEYGYDEDNPFLLYPNNFSLEFKLKSTDITDTFDVFDYLRDIESIYVDVYKSVNSAYTLYAAGEVDKTNISFDYRKRTFQLKVMDSLRRLTQEITKSDSLTLADYDVEKIDDFITDMVSIPGTEDRTLVWLIYWRFAYIDGSDYINYKNCYFNNCAYRHSASPFTKKGEFFKALLQQILARCVCVPYQKAYIVPLFEDFLYGNITDYFTFKIDPNNIISLNVKALNPNDKIKYTLRNYSFNAYGTQITSNSFAEDTTQHTHSSYDLEFCYPLPAGHDDFFDNGGTDHSASLFDVINGNKYYVHAFTQQYKDKTETWSSSSSPGPLKDFRNIAENGFGGYWNYKNALYQLKVKGLVEDFHKRFTFGGNIKPYYYGKYFYCAKAILDIHKNTTELLLVQL